MLDGALAIVYANAAAENLFELSKADRGRAAT